MMPANENCSACRFWLPADDKAAVEDARLGFGWCRRMPPVIVDHMARMSIAQVGFGGHHYDPEDIADVVSVEHACLHPATHYDAWCGEFASIVLEGPVA